jgi:hypothetical protein
VTDFPTLLRCLAKEGVEYISALAPHKPYLRGVPPDFPFIWDVCMIQRGLNITLTTELGIRGISYTSSAFGLLTLIRCCPALPIWREDLVPVPEFHK